MLSRWRRRVVAVVLGAVGPALVSYLLWFDYTGIAGWFLAVWVSGFVSAWIWVTESRIQDRDEQLKTLRDIAAGQRGVLTQADLDAKRERVLGHSFVS